MCSTVQVSPCRSKLPLYSVLHRGKTQPYRLERGYSVGARNSRADLYLPTCTMPQWLQL